MSLLKLPTGPNAIILLAHLMERDGTLGEETRARADRAAELHKQHDCIIKLMGWPYRPDSGIAIADAMLNYLVDEHGISPRRLSPDRRSRDTVGDAVLSKQAVHHMANATRFTVVTSDYHAGRAKRVFDFVYAGKHVITVEGVPTTPDEEKVSHEAHSLEAFAITFDGVSPGDDKAIVEAMLSRHPFYNGEVYLPLRL